MLYFNLIANWQIFFWTSTYFIIYCTYHRNCYNKTDFQPLYKTKTQKHTDIQIDKQTHKETEPLRTQTSQLLKMISVIGMIKPNLNSSCSRRRSCFAAASNTFHWLNVLWSFGSGKPGVVCLCVCVSVCLSVNSRLAKLLGRFQPNLSTLVP